MDGLTDNFAGLAGLVLGLMGTGFVAGVLAGLLGVGGGIVIVPVLCLVFELLELPAESAMHVAVGTSLACIVPTSISSMRAHYRRGAVDSDLFRKWAPALLVGAVAGVAIASAVGDDVLIAVFAVMACLVSVDLAFKREHFHLAPDLPTTGWPNRCLAGGIGTLSVMMGIGGGTLSVPVLCLFNYPIHRAVGTASALGLLIALPGALGYAMAGAEVMGRPVGSIGYVNLPGVAAIIPMTVLSAPLGAALAHRLSRLWLRRAFALFLAVTSARMFLELAS